MRSRQQDKTVRVKVYRFCLYDIGSEDFKISERMATRAASAASTPRSSSDPSSKIDKRHLNSDGMTQVGFFDRETLHDALADEAVASWLKANSALATAKSRHPPTIAVGPARGRFLGPVCRVLVRSRSAGRMLGGSLLKTGSNPAAARRPTLCASSRSDGLGAYGCPYRRSPLSPGLIYHAYLVHRSLDCLLTAGLIDLAHCIVLYVIDLLDTGCALRLGRQGVTLLAPDFGHLAIDGCRLVGAGGKERQDGCERKGSAGHKTEVLRRLGNGLSTIGSLSSSPGPHSRTVASLAMVLGAS
jgi:hypothetical protein